ncbi:MAG: hypothetical protein JW938_02185 [Candidatus Omnitrophica bacterium]|nr:hypothetical protein [Candidatus Omnitrophota bacterium]
MKKTRNSYLIICIVVACFFISTMLSSSASASELEDISTPETIGTQLVTPDKPAMPYVVTGESLVSTITNMVDFDINGATIIFNRPTGQLIVKNTPSNLSAVENILFEMRQSISRQVELEARIITVTSDEIDALGLQTTLGSSAFGMRSDNKGSIDVEHGITFPDVVDRNNANYYGQEFIFGVLDKHYSMNMAIDALKSIAEVNTLSAPRLTVFNNQRAHVKTSTITDYVSEVDAEVQADRDVLYYTVDTKVRQAPAGTILDVTPTINDDGTITLQLHPTFVTVDLDNTVNIESVATSASGGASLASNTLTLPIFTTQALDTTVVIPNGGVAVIGGLIDEVEILSKHNSPVLRWIPIIGNLFKNRNDRTTKSHLVIFVKATSVLASNIQPQRPL